MPVDPTRKAIALLIAIVFAVLCGCVPSAKLETPKVYTEFDVSSARLEGAAGMVRFHQKHPVSIREIPDVVIERESFRRFGLLSADTCTNCKEHWNSCKCEMGKGPLMFQNREKQSKETIVKELAKYGVDE